MDESLINQNSSIVSPDPDFSAKAEDFCIAFIKNKLASFIMKFSQVESCHPMSRWYDNILLSKAINSAIKSVI